MQTPPFRLRRGSTAPVQQSGTTCGAASLAVARMLADPEFAAWLHLAGTDQLDVARFAAYEQVVLRRTNGLRTAGGRLTAPWPRALGTSPLGALRELEGTVTGGSRYGVVVVRWQDEAALRRSYAAMTAATRSGRPVLVYVGNTLLPRHVVLAHFGGDGLDVYDPATGVVGPLEEDAYARRRLRLAGWDIPWLVLAPRSTG